MNRNNTVSVFQQQILVKQKWRKRTRMKTTQTTKTTKSKLVRSPFLAELTKFLRISVKNRNFAVKGKLRNTPWNCLACRKLWYVNIHVTVQQLSAVYLLFGCFEHVFHDLVRTLLGRTENLLPAEHTNALITNNSSLQSATNQNY